MSDDRVLVVIRDRDGNVVSRQNATAFVGTDIYQPWITYLRTGSGTVDSAEADAAHERLTIAQERYTEAETAWLLGCIGRGPRVPHPGRLDQYMPEEAR